MESTNFWDSSIWTFVVTLTVLLGAMIVATVLRQRISAIRRLMIPCSVLGGFMLLLVGFIYKQVTGSAMLSGSLLEILTYHGLGLGFAAMALRDLGRENKQKEMKGDSFDTSLGVIGSYLVQGILGLAVTISLFYVMGSFFASGLLLPMGYGQGPGQALNWGRTYENSYGFENGTSFGLTVAAAGFIASSIGGIIYLNNLRRKGIVSSAPDDQEETLSEQDISPKGEIPLLDAVDKFTIQMALVFLSYTLAYLFMLGVNAVVETGVLGGLGTTVQNLVWGFNFLFSTLFAILVKYLFRGMQKVGIIRQHFTNTFMQNRIAGLMFDVMVVASIAAINLSAFLVPEFVVPLLIICVLGGVATYWYLDAVAKNVFPAYRHEAFLSIYGMQTGTVSTGIILLREIDPQFKTPAANNLVYQQGWSILFGFPVLLLLGVAPVSVGRSFLTLGIMLVLFVVFNAILFRKKIFKKKPAAAPAPERGGGGQ